MARLEAQARSASAWLRFLASVAALALTPAPAQAGAWLAPEDGQEIWTNVTGLREGGVNFLETSAYYEFPVNERWAVVATPMLEQAYDVGNNGWRAEGTLALKAQVAHSDRAAMALQGGLAWNSWPGSGCGQMGMELRWLGGHSFGRTGFVNVEAAGRAFEGGCAGQRLELAAGYRPRRPWLAIGQVFMDARETGDSTIKAQFTMVRFRSGDRGIQMGVRARIDEGLAEPAIVLGIWGRPGG